MFFDRSVFRTCFFALYFYLLLFNCQGSITLSSLRRACLLYHSHFPLSIPFLKFFQKNFQLLLTVISPSFSRQLYYSTTFSPFCQHLFLIFFTFVHSFIFHNFFYPFLCKLPFRLLNFELIVLITVSLFILRNL